jgi:oxygen-independent coproporphyrinogen-3 oxidase
VHENSEIDFLRRERPRLFPGEEAQRRRYLRVRESALEAGFAHYEISNFCRPGMASRHNLKYWRCEPFLGLGPAAHSAVGGRRWAHPADLAKYLADPMAIEPAESDPASERIFLGLRLAEGIAVEEARLACGLSVEAFARRLDAFAPFVTRTGERMRLTPEGFLVSTPVLAGLLATS